jgi:hypothetical protein
MPTKKELDSDAEKADEAKVLMSDTENPTVPEPEVTDLGDDDEYEEYTPSRLRLLMEWLVKHKKKTLPILALLILIAIFIMPVSRYKVLGVVIKRQIQIVVIDEQSNLPVSEAEILVNGQTVVTDADGAARTEKTKVGFTEVIVTKKYYDEQNFKILVPLTGDDITRLSIKPNGRQVPVKAVNKITGKPVVGAVLSVLDTKVKTDENGEATVVLPPDNAEVDGLITADGFNQSRAKIKVNHLAVKENTFELIPAGKIYYLSKSTGKINVMKSNLDGTEPTVAVGATGSEQDGTTLLMVTSDWKYSILKARRDGERAKIYLLNADNDSLIEIDGDDNTDINVLGWAGNTFVYELNRLNKTYYQSKNYALKTYNADTGKITVLAENEASGDQYDYLASSINNVLLGESNILYSTTWNSRYESDRVSKKSSVTSISADGSNKRIVKEFSADKVSSIYGIQTDINTTYYRAYNGKDDINFAVINYQIDDSVVVTDNIFDKQYPRFLISPSTKSTLWAETRDGKQTLIVGDQNGLNGNEILKQGDYSPYAWFSDNYIIVSKESQLFIMPSNGVGSTGSIVKINSYHGTGSSSRGH